MALKLERRGGENGNGDGGEVDDVDTDGVGEEKDGA